MKADRQTRFVAKAERGAGWRVWDRMQKKWWGPTFASRPAELLAELNGAKRPARLVELVRDREKVPHRRTGRGSQA